MTEFENTVTEAQLQLRKDMRRDTDLRWDLLPVEPIKPARPYSGYLIYPALIAGVVGCGVMFLR
jgi:hypothetical protein